MADSSAQSFQKASKLLEGFSSFMEKLVYLSNESDQNRTKLWDLKKNIYFNMNSRAKIEEACLGLLKEKSSFISQPGARESTTSSTHDVSPRAAQTTHTSDISNQSDNKEVSKAPSIANENNKQRESLGGKGTQGSNTSMGPNWGKIDTNENFLVQIRAAVHLEGEKITEYMPAFGLVRSFNQPHESVFYAICFGFFERYVQNKKKEGKLSLSQMLKSKISNLDSDIQTLSSYLDKQLVPLMKNSVEKNLGEEELTEKFYEEVKNNSSLYNSCILIFKKILVKILENKKLDTAYRKNTFRWMNEVSNSEQTFYESIAELFSAKLRIFVLTFSKLVEKTFGGSDAPQFAPMVDTKPTKQDLTIFLDKATNHTYILYLTKEFVSLPKPVAVNNNSPSKRNKQRSVSPNLRYESSRYKDRVDTEPGLHLEMEEKKSVQQIIGETREKFESKTPKGVTTFRTKKSSTVSGANPFTLADFYPKTNDTNLFSKLAKKEENKSPEVKPDESVKTQIISSNPPKQVGVTVVSEPPASEDQVNTPENKGGVSKTNETTNKTRTTDYMNFKDTASLVDKIMDEINQKVKGTRDLSPVGNQEFKFDPKMKDIKAASEKGDNEDRGRDKAFGLPSKAEELVRHNSDKTPELHAKSFKAGAGVDLQLTQQPPMVVYLRTL